MQAQAPALLLIEDDLELAGMLAELLGDAYDVDAVGTGELGIEAAFRRRFDVMVVDRRLPGMDGVEFVGAVRRAGIRTPVLMLTALGTIDDRVSGLDGGANDYLTKPFDGAELLARLRTLRRGFAAERRRVEIGDWVFVPDTHTVHTPYGGRVLLTETESLLLERLAEHPDRVLSREELLERAFSSGETPGTVDTYVHYLRRKTSPDLIETVRGQGYRLGSPS